MINSVGSGMQMPPMQSSQASMTSDQKTQVEEILNQFSADNLSSEDATSIVESLSELNINPSKELEEIMADSGFSARDIGDMAGVEDGQRPPPPPPPQSGSSDSSEVVSFLEDLLENYDEQLSDEDKDSILSAVQEKFGLTGDSGSLVNVTA